MDGPGQITDLPDRLAPAEMARFREFFYRRTGIVFPEPKLPLVERRLMTTMRHLGFSGFREFLLSLKADAGGPAMQRVINALTVNETYFFRERHQLDLLTDALLPELTARRGAGQTVRIWSMPCSTGEEPYSIALHLLESWRDVERFEVEITGSDIDTNVLTAARQAVYSDRAVSRVPPDVLRRYFGRSSSGGHVLSRAVADAVALTAENILDPRVTARHRQMDVVFCRNLLIYFDLAARQTAIGHLWDCLRPGGYLLLGHAESMSRISSLFEPRRHAGHILYRRPLT